MRPKLIELSLTLVEFEELEAHLAKYRGSDAPYRPHLVSIHEKIKPIRERLNGAYKLFAKFPMREG